ncbi:MAG TPA: hypothetical protein VM689_17320 [Aliidongia sp.]|nr:hypothetical protein [Aliidongia sp.]
MLETTAPQPQQFRRIRLLWRGVPFVLVALVASCSTFLWTLGNRKPEPALLDGLPIAIGLSAEQAFTQRLIDRFPLGSNEADLVRELWLEGFRPVTDLKAARREASYETPVNQLNVCVTYGTVSWSADDAGRLSALTGRKLDGCL